MPPLNGPTVANGNLFGNTTLHTSVGGNNGGSGFSSSSSTYGSSGFVNLGNGVMTTRPKAPTLASISRLRMNSNKVIKDSADSSHAAFFDLEENVLEVNSHVVDDNQNNDSFDELKDALQNISNISQRQEIIDTVATSSPAILASKVLRNVELNDLYDIAYYDIYGNKFYKDNNIFNVDSAYFTICSYSWISYQYTVDEEYTISTEDGDLITKTQQVEKLGFTYTYIPIENIDIFKLNKKVEVVTYYCYLIQELGTGELTYQRYLGTVSEVDGTYYGENILQYGNLTLVEEPVIDESSPIYSYSLVFRNPPRDHDNDPTDRKIEVNDPWWYIIDDFTFNETIIKENTIDDPGWTILSEIVVNNETLAKINSKNDFIDFLHTYTLLEPSQVIKVLDKNTYIIESFTYHVPYQVRYTYQTYLDGIPTTKYSNRIKDYYTDKADIDVGFTMSINRDEVLNEDNNENEEEPTESEESLPTIFIRHNGIAKQIKVFTDKDDQQSYLKLTDNETTRISTFKSISSVEPYIELPGSENVGDMPVIDRTQSSTSLEELYKNLDTTSKFVKTKNSDLKIVNAGSFISTNNSKLGNSGNTLNTEVKNDIFLTFSYTYIDKDYVPSMAYTTSLSQLKKLKLQGKIKDIYAGIYIIPENSKETIFKRVKANLSDTASIGDNLTALYTYTAVRYNTLQKQRANSILYSGLMKYQEFLTFVDTREEFDYIEVSGFNYTYLFSEFSTYNYVTDKVYPFSEINTTYTYFSPETLEFELYTADNYDRPGIDGNGNVTTIKGDTSNVFIFTFNDYIFGTSYSSIKIKEYQWRNGVRQTWREVLFEDSAFSDKDKMDMQNAYAEEKNDLYYYNLTAMTENDSLCVIPVFKRQALERKNLKFQKTNNSASCYCNIDDEEVLGSYVGDIKWLKENNFILQDYKNVEVNTYSVIPFTIGNETILEFNGEYEYVQSTSSYIVSYEEGFGLQVQEQINEEGYWKRLFTSKVNPLLNVSYTYISEPYELSKNNISPWIKSEVIGFAENNKITYNEWKVTYVENYYYTYLDDFNIERLFVIDEKNYVVNTGDDVNFIGIMTGKDHFVDVTRRLNVTAQKDLVESVYQEEELLPINAYIESSFGISNRKQIVITETTYVPPTYVDVLSIDPITYEEVLNHVVQTEGHNAYTYILEDVPFLTSSYIWGMSPISIDGMDSLISAMENANQYMYGGGTNGYSFPETLGNAFRDAVAYSSTEDEIVDLTKQVKNLVKITNKIYQNLPDNFAYSYITINDLNNYSYQLHTDMQKMIFEHSKDNSNRIKSNKKLFEEFSYIMNEQTYALKLSAYSTYLAANKVINNVKDYTILTNVAYAYNYYKDEVTYHISPIKGSNQINKEFKVEKQLVTEEVPFENPEVMSIGYTYRFDSGFTELERIGLHALKTTRKYKEGDYYYTEEKITYQNIADVLADMKIKFEIPTKQEFIVDLSKQLYVHTDFSKSSPTEDAKKAIFRADALWSELVNGGFVEDK